MHMYMCVYVWMLYNWPCVILCSGNELSQVEGMEGVQQLMELVLDRNKIKVIRTPSDRC